MIINNEKEITRDKPIDKVGILDLELDINNKEKVDVEVQLLKNDEFIRRLLFYWSRMMNALFPAPWWCMRKQNPGFG